MSIPDDKFEIAARITAYLESKDIVVVPAMFESSPNMLCFIMPASEGTMKDFAGALSRGKICDYRAVSYVDAISGSPDLLDGLGRVMPEGYSIMALDIKDIRMRNLPTLPKDRPSYQELMERDMSLQGQMDYARIMLENLNKNALPEMAKDGIFFELAKPTLPSTCPKCGHKSYCDAAWMRSTDPEMPPTIFRACPCGQTVIEARPEDETPYIVMDLSDEVSGMKGQQS